jgi:hypothetical protein
VQKISTKLHYEYILRIQFKVFWRWCMALSINGFLDFSTVRIRSTRQHNISETVSVSLRRRGEGDTHSLGSLRDRYNWMTGQSEQLKNATWANSAEAVWLSLRKKGVEDGPLKRWTDPLDKHYDRNGPKGPSLAHHHDYCYEGFWRWCIIFVITEFLHFVPRAVF